MRRFSLPWPSTPRTETALPNAGESSAPKNALPNGHQSASGTASQFAELFQGLPIACFSFNAQGRILDWNPAAEALYGWSARDIKTKTLWQSLARLEDNNPLRQQLLRVFTGDSLSVEEQQFLCADGTTITVSTNTFPLHDAYDNIVSGLTACVDMSGRKKAEERLERHAFHDRLTGLPDRTLFLESVEAALRKSRQKEGHEFAVLLLNLDRFKVANESLGHGAGDQVLISTARKLEACVAPGDVVARLGGDEFALLLERINNDEEAIQTAERIQKRLSLPITANRQEIFISVSIGIVTARIGHTRAEEVLRDAHSAMDRAKASGKARYEIFDKGMTSRVGSSLQMEADLRRALGRFELRLDYQPIVSLSTGIIDGFECLIRWHHPTRGLVSPGQFIPIAEETGLIIPIGFWALKEACSQLAKWQSGNRPRALPLTVAVNISPKQFVQPNFVEQIKQIIKRSGADPSYLKLEITESAIMDNTEAAIEMVTQLKASGIKICLDDFGTGYSSLSYLHRFPFNVLKIDQSFVSHMDSDAKNEEIVRTIIALGHNLNMDIVAEGVERSTHLAQLRALKCHYGQGYFFAGGMDARNAQELVTANPQW